MSNVINWYDPTRLNNKVVLFEVTNLEGHAIWGGEQANEAVLWLMKDPLNRKLIASQWYADDDDARPVGEAINLTSLVLAAVAQGRERA